MQYDTHPWERPPICTLLVVFFFSIKLSLTFFKQIIVAHQEVCLYSVHLENIHKPTAYIYFHWYYCDINHNPQVHHCIHKNLRPVPIKSQINLVNATHPTSWRSILISSHYLFPGLPTEILYAPFLFHICAKCFTHLILLGLMTQIFGEYRS